LAQDSSAANPAPSRWQSWVGQQVDGVFPLLRYLGSSALGPVFETEYTDQGRVRAVIKFAAADTADATARLAQWQEASEMEHPHLLQIYAGGECQIGGANYIYVVMEYADESVAGVLAERKLTLGETREMLGPLINALQFLHSKGYVHGAIKPSNVMAVGEQIKISSDSMIRSDQTQVDLRALGALLLDVLEAPLPEPFRTIAERCSGASGQLTLNGIEQMLKSPTIERVTDGPSVAPLPQAKEINPALWIGGGGFALLIILLVVLWLGREYSFEPAPASESSPPPGAAGASANEATNAAPSGPLPGAESGKQAKSKEAKKGSAREDREEEASSNARKSKENETKSDNVAPPEDVGAPVNAGAPVPSSAIEKRVLPDIPRKARDTISGRVAINVRLNVDASGNVISATPAPPFASKYFTGYTLDAARAWKFAPADEPREILLRFQLRRTESEVSVLSVRK
jgi:hypothetical protein